MNCSMDSSMAAAASPAQRFARQALVSLAVLAAGLSDHLGPKPRRGRRPVPVEHIQVIAEALLVEAWRVRAGLVAVGGPEARGVGRQHLVDENDPAIQEAELKLGVGHDD